jgi:hypothetical protein
MGDYAGNVKLCTSYPLQCIFSYFYTTLLCFNLSSGFLGSYKGMFVCVESFLNPFYEKRSIESPILLSC